MVAILQTIVWKQYFIHIAPKFGKWFGNVFCQMETTTLRIVHNMLTHSGPGNVTVILQTMFSNLFKLHQIVSKLHLDLKINLEAHSSK